MGNEPSLQADTSSLQEMPVTTQPFPLQILPSSPAPAEKDDTNLSKLTVHYMDLHQGTCSPQSDDFSLKDEEGQEQFKIGMDYSDIVNTSEGKAVLRNTKPTHGGNFLREALKPSRDIAVLTDATGRPLVRLVSVNYWDCVHILVEEGGEALVVASINVDGTYDYHGKNNLFVFLHAEPLPLDQILEKDVDVTDGLKPHMVVNHLLDFFMSQEGEPSKIAMIRERKSQRGTLLRAALNSSSKFDFTVAPGMDVPYVVICGFAVANILARKADQRRQGGYPVQLL